MNEANAMPVDTHSYAKPLEAKVKHMSLNLKADFDQQILKGKVSYDIENNNADQIIFDVKNLVIESVAMDDNVPTTYKLGNEDPIKGKALTIDINPDVKRVHIQYSTTEGSQALLWLNPLQTAGKIQPFLFTQGQAILTRTWIPSQDSPGIRITYDATVQVPKDLLALMSASNPTEKNAKGIYHFEMKQAIPPYLIALSIGDLEFEAIGEKTGVYAEPALLKRAIYEFGDMEKMLNTAEELYGEYLWDRYDVIVLPPSFPFGGMENPRLTFATPTILAGDRSLTSLIAHELAHSWSGNLVTNATWNDFWLNEGFTVYFERRIMEAIYGEDYVKMLTMLGYQDLQGTIEDLGSGHADTKLELDLEGRDPDDGMTDIAYEKGAHFLMMLEEKVGREKFDLFLNQYFNEYKFKTIHTSAFKTYLKENLLEKYNVDADIDEWIHKAGLPSNCPIVKSEKFDLVDQQIKTMLAGDPINASTTSDWTTHEWLHFIRHLPNEMTFEQMQKLDNTIGLSNSGNSEILAAWFQLSIENGYYKNNLDQIEKFLTSVGRRKFLTPLYKAFKENDALETARNIYKKARDSYHSVAVNTMDELLDIKIKG
jgi:leukotriene A-4 hydrolase/aminopeptidase